MGAKKISALPAASLALTGAETMPAVQGGATVKLTVDQLLATPMAFQPSGPENTLASRLGYVLNVLDFPGATFAAQLQAAHDTAAALGGGRIFIPPGSYAINTTTSGAINITGANIEFVSPARRAAKITFSGTGPHIIIGGSTLQAQEIGFRGLYFASPAGQTLIKTRYARGVRFFGCKVQADNFLTLGDDSLSTSFPTYIVELYDGCELNRIASGTNTRHYVDCRNFAGQWVANCIFYEGALTSGLAGWRTADNIQPKIDDVNWITCYWSRDDVNIDCTDGRVVNFKATNLHSEGALTNCLKLAISSATTKNKLYVGCEGVIITGGRFDSVGPSILIQHNRNESGVEALSLISLMGAEIEGSNGVQTPIVVESLTATSIVKQLTILGVTGSINATDTSQDFVRITGSTTLGAIADVKVDGINAASTNGNALRSALRIEGTGNERVAHGANINGKNTTLRVDDQSGVTLRNGRIKKATTQGFGSVSAGSSVTSPVGGITGVKAGDFVMGEVTSAPPAGLVFSYIATATGTVTIKCSNPTAGSLSSGSVDFLLLIIPADL